MSDFLDRARSGWKSSGIVIQIIVINVILFIALNISLNFGGHLREYLALPLDMGEFIRKPWTLITSIFSHEALGHVFANLLWFYFLARIFTFITGFTHWSKITFLYLAGGIAGNLLVFITSLLVPQFINAPYGLGASGAIMAIALAAAFYSPNFVVNLFLFGEVKLKWLVAVLFIITTLVDLSSNSGGKVAHLGGALFGVLFGIQLKNGRDLSAWFTNAFKPRHKVKMKVVHSRRAVNDHEYNQLKRDDERVLNDLLDKINKSGYESLSKQEKETLHILSKKK